MKIQAVELEVNFADTGVGAFVVKIVSKYNKFLPISFPGYATMPPDIKFRYIGKTSDWGVLSRDIYTVDIFSVWLFWLLVHRLERTLDLLIIGFIYILEVWGLANVPVFEKPSLRCIFKKKQEQQILRPTRPLSPVEIERIQEEMQSCQLIVMPEGMPDIDQIRGGFPILNFPVMGNSTDRVVIPRVPDHIGDLTCKYNARSPYLRCAVNPCGPCNECSSYENFLVQ